MSTPTDEQVAIIEAVAAGESLAMEAFAGCGKTSTASKAEAGLTRTIANLCFAKRNQLDFEEKMPKGTTNKTFNSFGLSGLIKLTGRRPKGVMSNYGGREKTYSIMDEMSLSRDDFPDMAQLIGLLKNQGYVPAGAINYPTGRQPVTPQQVVEDFDLDMGEALPEAYTEVADKILKTSISMAWDMLIDFDDQLYIPTLWGAPFDSFDSVFVDEYQDLSPIQILMVDRITRQGTCQLFMAGDTNQAIYAFRGARSDSAEHLREKYSLKVYPLSMSFRCPRAVVREAATIVPGIRPWSGAAEGECFTPDDWSVKDFAYGDVILCRNTKPLIPLFYRTLSLGIGAKVLGSEIGKGLITIVKKLTKPNPMASAEWLSSAVKDWRQSQVIHYQNKKQPLKAAAKAEQAEVILLLAEKEPTAHAVVMRLQDMFSDKRAPVTFSTIHKAKGLEWPRVWLLDRGLIPSPYAQSAEELQQEQNLLYVGITRAQQSLRFIYSNQR